MYHEFKMKHKLGIILGFVIWALVFLASRVNAASFGGIGVRPANPDAGNPLTESWFIYNLLPGEVKEDGVIISNTSDKEVRVKVYPVDGTTTADGAFALLSEKEERKSVGSWVKLDRNEVTVEPGGEKTVKFTISIPSGAAVGDHLGGIVIENMEVGKGKGVNVVTRVGARIYQTVPGELIRKLILTNFSWAVVEDKPTFYFELENQGNVHLDPKGEMKIKDGFVGIPLFKSDFDLRMVIPGKPTKVPVVWEKRWPVGKFTAQVAIAYGDQPSERIEKEISFWYVSRGAKLAMAMLVGALVIVGLIRKVAGLRR